jgi:hypothetical protein
MLIFRKCAELDLKHTGSVVLGEGNDFDCGILQVERVQRHVAVEGVIFALMIAREKYI